VSRFVLGYPKNMDGSLGPRAEKSAAFKALLEARSEIPVTLWDERRTTIAAHEILHQNGKKMKKHRQSVDAVAASLILEGYLGTL
jgi:putative Holliday junction resolvase